MAVWPVLLAVGILRYYPYSSSWSFILLNWFELATCEVTEKDGVDLISSFPFTLNGA